MVNEIRCRELVTKMNELEEINEELSRRIRKYANLCIDKYKEQHEANEKLIEAYAKELLLLTFGQR